MTQEIKKSAAIIVKKNAHNLHLGVTKYIIGHFLVEEFGITDEEGVRYIEEATKEFLNA